MQKTSLTHLAEGQLAAARDASSGRSSFTRSILVARPEHGHVRGAPGPGAGCGTEGSRRHRGPVRRPGTTTKAP